VTATPAAAFRLAIAFSQSCSGLDIGLPNDVVETCSYDSLRARESASLALLAAVD
jgi:hypothetical protein